MSVISEALVKRLNRPINKQTNTNVVFANSQSTISPGNCILPIRIENTLFPCTAIILKESSQHVSSGMNWLTANRVIINKKRRIFEHQLQQQSILQTYTKCLI